MHISCVTASIIFAKSLRVTKLVRRGELHPLASPPRELHPLPSPPQSRVTRRRPARWRGNQGWGEQKDGNRGNGKGSLRQMGKKRKGEEEHRGKQEQSDDWREALGTVRPKCDCDGEGHLGGVIVASCDWAKDAGRRNRHQGEGEGRGE